MHGLIMIFGAIMPAWVGLANWMIPMQVGAPDMVLPRLNNFSFWILPFTLLLASLFVPGGPRSGGWTMYPPLMLQMGDAFPMTIFSIHLLGIYSILGAIDVIVTIGQPDPTLCYAPLRVAIKRRSSGTQEPQLVPALSLAPMARGS
jgi:cytochrome c oxidase subunit I